MTDGHNPVNCEAIAVRVSTRSVNITTWSRGTPHEPEIRTYTIPCG
jgi:hypothetical protein